MEKLLSSTVVTQIRKMIDNVLAHPEEYDQDAYPETMYNYNGDPIPNDVGFATTGTTCRTDFCAAGHIIFARSPDAFKRLANHASAVDWPKKAQLELGKPFSKYLRSVEKKYFHGGLINSLFGTYGAWPERYLRMYNRASNLKTLKARQNGYAKAFAARWNGFIESDGHDIEPDYYDNLKKAKAKKATA